ncbi:MAG: type I-C CRISPR-associated protein Cas8c/Csd1 [Vallitaleaceae bacterium]|nr:type I-C CRISPR-associated protein Cas8c/Csd1 [Vallitaleaceae bacterium]
MLLQALTNYYELLSEDSDVDIPLRGYSKAGISYAANISLEGELLNIIPLKILDSKGKKYIPREMIVPEQEKKASGIRSNFLCENTSYFFGIDSKGKPEKSIQRFEAFKALHIKVLENVDDNEAQAIVNFVSHWNPEEAEKHPALKEHLEDMMKGSNIIFQYDKNNRTYCHQDSRIKDAWESYKEDNQSVAMRQCLVTGKKTGTAILHPSIKGIRGGQSMGCSLVSFNGASYESYGNRDSQGLNAPVSEYATFAYSTALSHMLKDSDNKLYLGDTTVIYWAETKNSVTKDLMALFLNPSALVESDEVNSRVIRDQRAIKTIGEIFHRISEGRRILFDDDLFDPLTKIYILGLVPNAARLSIRFFIQDNLDGFIQKMGQHYKDIQIEKQYDNEMNVIPLWRLLSETVSDNSRDKAASPLLAGSTMRAILMGLYYPLSLYQSILIRIKTDHSINYYKAAIIKGFLIRKDRQKYEEEITMALNEQSTNKAYVLGRLFATLEKAQEDANPGIKSTIKDRYFTSACTTPSVVFPVILKLSNHHISKSDYGYVSENRIKTIMELLDVGDRPFPKNLSLDDQGIFVLGYYHQKNIFYKKVEKES